MSDMGVFSEYLNFRLPISNFGIIFLSIVLFYILKHVLRRRKYAVLPGPTFHWFDVMGVINFLPIFSSKNWNGHNLQTIFIHVLEGITRYFPDDKLVVAWVGFSPVVFPLSPEAVQECMTDSSLIEKPYIYKFIQPVLGTGLSTSIASKWKPRRKMLNPSFHVSVLMDFIPIFNENGAKLVKNLQKGSDGEVVELLEPLSMCVMDVAGETVLGAKIGAQDGKNKEYIDALRMIHKAVMKRAVTVSLWPEFIFRNTELGRKFYKSQQIIRQFTTAVLKEKKKEYLSSDPKTLEKKKSLMDILLKFHMEKKNLNDEDILEEVETFTPASNDSTGPCLLFTLYLLGLDKEVQANAHKVLDDIFGEDKERHVSKEDLTKLNYLECILKESLRLYPPVPVFAREMPEETTVCGHTLPAGTTVSVSPYLLHRDPRLYPDPEKFDPSRFFPENCADRSHYAFIPFSAGSRNCIGQKSAMIEMKIVLAFVLRNFTVESLDSRDKVMPAAEITLVTPVPVRFKLYART